MTPLALADFWDMERADRERRLVDGILAAHARHYQKNLAYRRAVSARGVGPEAKPEDLPRLLRLTSQTFKSYIEVLGLPFHKMTREASSIGLPPNFRWNCRRIVLRGWPSAIALWRPCCLLLNAPARI